jgi:hypothetical protein
MHPLATRYAHPCNRWTIQNQVNRHSVLAELGPANATGDGSGTAQAIRQQSAKIVNNAGRLAPQRFSEGRR